MKHVILSFQTSRQYLEATNKTNHVFLYCAFLDFRYCLPGRLPGKGEAPLGARCPGMLVTCHVLTPVPHFWK